MDNALFAQLLAKHSAASPAEAAPPPQPEAPMPQEAPAAPAGGGEEVQGPELPPVGDPSLQGQKPAPEPGLGHPGDGPVAALGGVAQAVIQTKDFFTGNTAEADKSDLRKNIESTTKELGEESTVNALTTGVAQFATGMLGAGKITGALRLGGMAVEAGKAAAVGAMAFDPHGGRLSDIVEQVPALRNPVTRFLSSKPDDSAAVGRLKNAIESIGMDATLGTVLLAATKVYRARANGSTRQAANAEKELQNVLSGETPGRGGDGDPGASPGAGTDVGAGEGPGAGGGSAEHPAGPLEGGDAAAPPPLSEAPAPAGVPGELPPGSAPGEASGPLEVTTHPSGFEGEQQIHSDTGLPGEGVQVEPVANATEAGAPKKPDLMSIPEDKIPGVLKGLADDAEAIQTHGNWENAIAAGHRFSSTEFTIPYAKMAVGTGGEQGSVLRSMIDRVSASLEAEFNARKGGAVLSDREVNARAGQWHEMWGVDPAATLGAFAQAGKDANTLVFKMEAAYGVATRAFNDAAQMSSMMKSGMAGDMEASKQQLIQMLQTGADSLASANAIRASAGRIMRRMRQDFGVNVDNLKSMADMSPEQLAHLVESAGGDPRAMRTLVEPGLWKKGMDWAQYLYVNNLLWGPRTHFVNFVGNLYQVMGRPLERIIGSSVQRAVGAVRGDDQAVANALRTRQESLRQYTYLGSTLADSWKSAVEAWRIGDSPLTPHMQEVAQVGHNIGQYVAQSEFKPHTSLANVLNNALVAGAKLVGTPTRALGASDELVKQVIYRSKVLADAHVEGVTQGLQGAQLNSFVKTALEDAFDDAGRAVNMSAVQEARVATFQQDLLPGTVGKAVQNFTSNVPAARFILPFVKTPTNVIRQGIKLTPGLNVLQQEYRQMIRGELGPEAQAQAIGQMSMGSLFMGTAAMLAYSGSITGGGPSDQKAKSELMATGWQPYSFVTTDKDGKPTYVNFSRYDPVAMPFGLMADLVDILSREQDGDTTSDKTQAAATAVLMGLIKNLGNKTYLQSLTQTMDAVMAPGDDTGGKAGQAVAKTAANFLPLASGLRFANNAFFDPHLRDARSFVDNIMSQVPGLSDKLPAKYDAFGQPKTVHPGLWVNGNGGLVANEIRRMVDEAAVAPPGPPQASIGGVDLREIQLKDGRNAYEVYQQLAGRPSPRTRPLVDVVAQIMKTPAYQHVLVDGEAGIKGTKLHAIAGPIAQYRAAALKQIKADPNVQTAMGKRGAEIRAAMKEQRAQNTGASAGQRQEAINSALGAGE